MLCKFGLEKPNFGKNTSVFFLTEFALRVVFIYPVHHNKGQPKQRTHRVVHSENYYTLFYIRIT